ncbi:unnamed protein product [Effrenium voratum]|uniref:C3H1-type domain-containing protein n=1 Tax=Effrenium voratum TaxID=2562239 RepID=A0AA36HL44_9DINO|nr:unnamed protein product [Effrenium voratum]
MEAEGATPRRMDVAADYGPVNPGEITPNKSTSRGRKTREVKKPAEVKTSNENAVTARLLKTKMCYFFERGKCASSTCRYAHSSSELRKPPNLQKTKLCKAFAEGRCTKGDNCVFAHGEVQLRVTDGIYKTQMCHFFERGRCLKGERCNHAHGPDDLRQPKQAKPDLEATPGPEAKVMEPPVACMASLAAAAAHAAQAQAALGMYTPTHDLMTWPMPWYASQGLATPESYYLGPSPQLHPLPANAAGEAWAEVQPCDLSKRLASLDVACLDLERDVRGIQEANEGQRRVHRI